MLSRTQSPGRHAPQDLNRSWADILRCPDMPVMALSCCLMVGLLFPQWSMGQSANSVTLTPNQLQRRTPVVEVFQNCRDAVVNISSTQIIEQRTGLDLFGGLFDLDVQIPGGVQRYKATSVGSGFVIHPAGYIVTNAHVIARTSERKVIFPDKREFDAEIVAVDHEHDLAILKIAAPNPLKPLKLGKSSDLMVGESVVAIGNPFGYQNTCTAGVVSALDRELQVNEQLVFRGLIQTDASINPGNSGGPLLNILGELIGVNTAIRGDAQNIGFAIPVDQLRTLLPDMISVERRNRIALGMRVAIDGHPKIVSVDKDGPADRAGLQPGDVLVQIEGQQVGSGLDFYIDLIPHKAGDVLPVLFARGSQLMETRLTLGQRVKPDGVALLRDRLGVQAQPLSDKGARAVLLRPGMGMVITKIEDNGPAAKAGLDRGDVIMQVGRHPVSNLDEIAELLASVDPGHAVLLTIRRVSGRNIQQGTISVPLR